MKVSSFGKCTRRAFFSIYGKPKKAKLQLKSGLQDREQSKPNDVLPSAEFDLFLENIRPEQTLQTEISKLSKIEFETNNRRLSSKMKEGLQTKVSQLRENFATIHPEALKDFPFAFVAEPRDAVCTDICGHFEEYDQDTRSFITTNEEEFKLAATELVRDFVRAVNAGKLQDSKAIIEPLMMRKLRQSLQYLTANGLVLEISIENSHENLELIGYKNYLLAGIHPNRKKNFPMHFYYEAHERILDVDVELVKKKRPEQDIDGYLVSRIICSSNLKVDTKIFNSDKKVVYERESGPSRPDSFIFDYVFAEFDYKTLQKVGSQEDYLAERMSQGIKEGLFLSDVNGLMLGNPFYKVYDFGKLKKK
jgi:hypothetical protein